MLMCFARPRRPMCRPATSSGTALEALAASTWATLQPWLLRLRSRHRLLDSFCLVGPRQVPPYTSAAAPRKHSPLHFEAARMLQAYASPLLGGLLQGLRAASVATAHRAAFSSLPERAGQQDPRVRVAKSHFGPTSCPSREALVLTPVQRDNRGTPTVADVGELRPGCSCSAGGLGRGCGGSRRRGHGCGNGAH